MLSELRIDKGFWYLGSPYSRYHAGIDIAAMVAARIAGELALRGIPVYSPIAESHAIARAAGIDPLDHEFWMNRDQPFMGASHGLIVAEMRGWQESVGLGAEILIFAESNRPVVHFDPRVLGIVA